MKTRVPILMFFLGLGAAGEDVLLMREYSATGGVQYEHRVTREDFRAVPPWEPGPTAKLPLARDRAVESAMQAAAKEGKVTLEMVTLQPVNRFETDIIKRLPQDGCRWYYVVWLKPAGKENVAYVVTMNGAVATRTVLKR
jgi:hypothetical protein